MGYTPRISRALHALNNECVREASERPTAWSWKCRLNTEQQSEQKDNNIKMRGVLGRLVVLVRWCGSASAESESDQLVECVAVERGSLVRSSRSVAVLSSE